MMIFKCWEWLRNFGDDSLPPTHPTPYSSVPPELCDDVLIDILLRLPPDVLSRFKCASSQSYRLINDPDFLQRYRSQLPDHPNAFAGLFYQHQHRNQVGFAIAIAIAIAIANANARLDCKKRGLQCIDKSLSFLPNPVRILASRHGLVLCTSTKPNSVRYYVCNPITRQRGLASGKQRPMRFVLDRVLRGPEVEVAEAGIVSPYCLFSHAWPAVQWKRSLHWVDGLGSILAYDIAGEKFRFLELPCVDVRDQRQYKRVVIKYGVLGVSEGLLSYAFSDAYSLHVWVRVCNNWKVVWRVSLGALVSKNLEVLRRSLGNLNFENEAGPVGRSLLFKPVCFDAFNRKVVFLRVPGWIVSYHFELGKIEAIQDHSEEQKIEVAFPYVVPQLPFSVEFSSTDRMHHNQI